MIDLVLEVLSPGRTRRLETTTIRRDAERECERVQGEVEMTVRRYRANGKPVPLRRREDRDDEDTVPGAASG